MSAGDITRLNRMYNCPNYEASITVNGTSTKSTTQFPNGVDGEQTPAKPINTTRDNGDDLEKDGMKLKPNDTLTNDDSDDDMVLSKIQLDALYSLNAAKRNGLKSAFHHWPLGVVAFEIDPTFRKTFTAFYILLLLPLVFLSSFSALSPQRIASLSFFSEKGAKRKNSWNHKRKKRQERNKKRRRQKEPERNSIYFTDPEFISTIYESMSYIMNRSCIRFTPRTSYHKNYIYITKGPGCSSEVGMRHTGKQLMNINEELCPRGKIIHELLHSLGFLHMHTAK
jgi:Astacin (Peptidase family M12A)